MVKKFLWLISILTILIFSTFLISGCDEQPDEEEVAGEEMMEDENNSDEMSQVERGEFLVTIGGCDDCHTPFKMSDQGPVRDQSMRLAGHPEDAQIPEYDKVILQNWMLMSHDMTTFVGPWGTSFSANITPDKETGIGTWQPEMFINAIRTGKHLGVEDSRPILPPMPLEGLKELSDEDLRSIFAYLQTLAPVKNKVPDPIMNQPPPQEN